MGIGLHKFISHTKQGFTSRSVSQLFPNVAKAKVRFGWPFCFLSFKWGVEWCGF